MNTMQQDFIKEFPVLNQYTYINTAVCGLLSESLLEWRRQHDVDLLNRGSIFRETNHQFIDKVRKTVGEFFHLQFQKCSAPTQFFPTVLISF